MHVCVPHLLSPPSQVPIAVVVDYIQTGVSPGFLRMLGALLVLLGFLGINFYVTSSWLTSCCCWLPLTRGRSKAGSEEVESPVQGVVETREADRGMPRGSEEWARLGEGVRGIWTAVGDLLEGVRERMDGWRTQAQAGDDRDTRHLLSVTPEGGT